MAAGGGSLSGFPVLEVKSNNVSGSYKEWLDEFTLAVEFKTLDMGTEEVDDPAGAERPKIKQDKFTEKAKTIVLLRCIGSDGRRVLASEGYTDITKRAAPMYNVILGVLEKHFGATESKYVKTQKFVTVRQGAGEEYSSYLLRVEALSRSLGMFNNDNDAVREAVQGIRQDLALVLAVNGLRDQVLCRELIAKTDLTWESLGNILRSRATADEAVEKIHGSAKLASENEIKVETVGAVDSKSKRSSNYHRGKYDNKGARPKASRDRAYRDKYSSGDSDYSHRSNSRGSNSEGSTRRYSDSSDGGSRKYHRSRKDQYSQGNKSGSLSKRSVEFYQKHGTARSRSRDGEGRDTCYECGLPGHALRVCPSILCYRCYRRGHLAGDCKRSRCEKCSGRPHRRGSRCPGSSSSGKSSVKFKDVNQVSEGDSDPYSLP